MTEDNPYQPGRRTPRLIAIVKRSADRARLLFGRLLVVESGALAAEYAFLIVFVAILAAVGMIVLGDDLRIFFENLAAAIDGASQPTPDPFAS